VGEWVTVSEAVVLGLLLLAVLGIALLWLRRHLLASGGPLLPCALRTPPSTAWRLGLLRFGAESLDWFTLGGLTLRPARTWRRSSVGIGIPQPTTEPIPGLPDPLRVTAEADGQQFEFAMARGTHTAMRSWMESAPPGFGVNIT
jgi:hypothetical protein